MLKIQDGSIGNVIFHNITRLEKVSQLKLFNSLVLIQNEDTIDLWLTNDETSAIKDLMRLYERYYSIRLVDVMKSIIRLDKMKK